MQQLYFENINGDVMHYSAYTRDNSQSKRLHYVDAASIWVITKKISCSRATSAAASLHAVKKNLDESNFCLKWVPVLNTNTLTPAPALCLFFCFLLLTFFLLFNFVYVWLLFYFCFVICSCILFSNLFQNHFK